MTDRSEHHNQHDATAPTPDLAARRRLLKGGLSVAPVALTVTSRPVLATGTCHGPTGFQSANLSRNVGKMKDPACGTRNMPANWADSNTGWPTGCGRTDKFRTHFPNSTLFLTDADTMDKVVKGTASGGTAEQKEVAKLVVAALLNSYSTSVPTATQIKAIWHGYCSPTGYRPGGELAWSGEKIRKYLSYTMGVVYGSF